jgi:hypothetical protein
MKTIISFVVLGFSVISLTGCYTRIATSDDQDYIYEKPETIIVIIPSPPLPEPSPCPPPVYYPTPPYQPDPPKEKIRNTEPDTRPGSSYDGNQRDKLRRSGSRNESDKRNR